MIPLNQSWRGQIPQHRPQAVLLAFLGAVACLAVGAAPERQVLFQPEIDQSRIKATDAQISVVVSPAGRRLQVTTGHAGTWPGIGIKPPNGPWDLAPFQEVMVGLQNVGTNTVVVSCRVDSPGADGSNHCVTGALRLEPQQSGKLHVTLKRASDDHLSGKLFGMRGYPVAAGGPGTVDPKQITQVLVFVAKPSSSHSFQIERIEANVTYVAPTAWTSDADPFFPFLDTFGQYKHKDWPGKTHSETELLQRTEQEALALRADTGPSDWDKYGGWSNGPSLEATGYFRTQKYQGKWWLVDPDGRLFFSHGIDCVRSRDVTPVEERESWFEKFPGENPELRPFVVQGAFALKGHYAGRSPRSFCFGEANLRRKYGPSWAESYPAVIHQRLRNWGLNSIGMWSDAKTFLMRRTPYADSIGSRGVRMIEGSEGYWGKFPDVWDPAFRTQLQGAMASKVRSSAGDPWCLGYFADNEMSWGDETSLAVAALRSPEDQPAKQAFVAQLQSKYTRIEELNRAWKTEHTSWKDLLETRQAPPQGNARTDLTAFYTQTAEQYFRTVREVIKEKAPHQLYLGCRFAWVNPLASAAAAKYCDVVSYNLYQRSVADFRFNGGADVPLMIGEFHFGALDRGMFHTGLVSTADQKARAQDYKDYVEGALRHPLFVGCHWFQYQDEPATGRVYDEENYQIGFVDVADTPYLETVQACRQVAEEMYRVRSGH